VVALNPAHGREEPLRRALIDEARCIGCTLCIAACPVDAIVGGARSMHTVLADRCTGCRLCVAPCPVDCIALVDAGFTWTDRHAELARAHFAARKQRRELAARRRRDVRAPEPDQAAATSGRAAAGTAEERMRVTIAAALARARQRRGSGTP
jgi:electron transport complex protein RnfB